MAKGQIIVETKELDRAYERVNQLADTYKSNYDGLYVVVKDMQNAWAGEDNVAFTNQIEQFRNDFQNMEKLMRDYAEYLHRTAETYRQTQDNIMNTAKTLSTGN